MEMETELKELIDHIEELCNKAVTKQDWEAIYTMRNIAYQMDEKIFDIITKIVIPLKVSAQLEEEFG